MAGLLDIGPLSRKVTIRGVELDVIGLTNRGILSLLDQFPELRKVLSGAGIALKPEDLLMQVPGAIEVAIAYVTGSPNDEKAVVAARALTVGEQFEILKVAWELTFPNGVRSFAAALEAMGLLIVPTWDQGTQSPGQSSSLSQAATPQTSSGSTPQDNPTAT